jgi:hypothetical protein
MLQETERFSWKEHHVLQGDGRGGLVAHPAEYQFVPRFGELKVLPFGLAAMDNWPHLHHQNLGAVTWETGDMWYGCASGHLSSVLLGDGSILTAYGHYAYGGALIKWRPVA